MDYGYCSTMNSKVDLGKKQKLYITLFEPQLIRSYLLAYKSDFLIDLNNEFKVVIITSTKLDSLVKEGISKAGLDGSVLTINFDGYKDSFFTSLISFFLYWSNKSPAIKLRIHRLWLQDKNILKSMARILVNRTMPGNRLNIKFFRLLFYVSFKYGSWHNNSYRSFNIIRTDLLFVTSLTNTWEDIPIALHFKMNKARIIGTVRSWDNLTNHGYLKLVPDIFLSHSENLSRYALKFQNIPSENIYASVTPVYQELYKPAKSSDSLKIVKISYMCMGLSTNPDDENFVKWLINEWRLLPNGFHLTILQHPKFILNLDLANLNDNITIQVFQYENSNLMDYYEFISQQNLVLCGGTTAALDAAFIGIPVAAIGFEIVRQTYSSSALRYFDKKPHTKDFFDKCNVLTLRSKSDLMLCLEKYNEIHAINNNLVSEFTGKSDINFNDLLIKALKAY